ncbi:MAG TPA: hypothetical protein VG122_00960 [Gemmata sp.]|jgi:hypothetical protein|nr:hypothetical protein [Gemmata sp.]
MREVEGNEPSGWVTVSRSGSLTALPKSHVENSGGRENQPGGIVRRVLKDGREGGLVVDEFQTHV